MNREGGYDLRRELNLKNIEARTTMKMMCTCVRGVKIWNKLPEIIQRSKNINQFKKLMKISYLEKYKS